MKLLQSFTECESTKFINWKDPLPVGKIIISGATGSGIFMADGTSVVDEDGNIDAPVTSTNLTLSGTLAVTGASTMTGAVTMASTLDVTGAVGITGITTLGGAIDVSTLATTVTDEDAQAGTVSIAELLGGVVTQNSKTGASTLTFPTGTAISAGITTLAVGDSFDVFYYNRGDQTVTLTGDTGSTITGNATVATHLSVLLKFVNTGTNTWNVYTLVSA